MPAPHFGQLESWLSSGAEIGPAIADSFGVYKERLLLLIFSIVQDSEEVDVVRLKATMFERQKGRYLDEGWWGWQAWQLTRDELGLGRNAA